MQGQGIGNALGYIPKAPDAQPMGGPYATQASQMGGRFSPTFANPMGGQYAPQPGMPALPPGMGAHGPAKGGLPGLDNFAGGMMGGYGRLPGAFAQSLAQSIFRNRAAPGGQAPQGGGSAPVRML